MKRLSKSLILMGGTLLLGTTLVNRGKKQVSSSVNWKKQITQPVFSFKKAIRETVWVQTCVDSDDDGKNDLIKVDIIRPKETAQGLRVPVIYNDSPYNTDKDYPDYYSVDVKHQGPLPAFTEKYHYDKYFVRRGYAIVNASSIGTKGSDGCPTVGNKQEILAAKAVIDWLNHRCDAYNDQNELVRADWTTGKTGMIGLSYEGTIPNGLVTTGVEGLETIVPIGAISNWYDYYRANGAVVAPGGYQGDDADRLARGVLTREDPEACTECVDQIVADQERSTGDYNDFWDERNYLKNADSIKASVFVVHGLNDMNVKRKQFAQWWNQLKQHNVPRKLWLHQGGHIDPKVNGKNDWMETLQRWFDCWLYDLDNGIMEEEPVTIQRADGAWVHEQEWPHVSSGAQTFYLSEEDNGQGLLTTEEIKLQEQTHSTFTDRPLTKADELIKNPEMVSSHRLAYITSKLEEPVRLSGFPHVCVEASLDQKTATLTALLVDYSHETSTIVTRGWMNAGNVHSLWESEDLQKGHRYTFHWDIEPHDYVFARGHRIGMVLIASDYEYTLRPNTSVSVTVYYGSSHIYLPLTTIK